MFNRVFTNVKPMRNQTVIFELIPSAFYGFIGKELDAIIWMFLSVEFYSCVQKSVSQLD